MCLSGKPFILVFGSLKDRSVKAPWDSHLVLSSTRILVRLSHHLRVMTSLNSYLSVLEPFYETRDKPWTSVPLTDTTRLSYSYPDFDKIRGASPDLVRDYINDHIDKRYGMKKSGKNHALDLLSDFKGITAEHDKELKMFDYAIHASWKKFELNDSFAIIFYFAVDGNTNVKKENYIGSINVFRGTTPDGCANCRTQNDLVQEAYVGLSRFIARDIGTFDPQAVQHYLKEKKLSYKIVLVSDDIPKLYS